LAESLWRIDPLSVSFTCEDDGGTPPPRKRCRRNASRDSNMPGIHSRRGYVYLLVGGARTAPETRVRRARAGPIYAGPYSARGHDWRGTLLSHKASVADAPQSDKPMERGQIFLRGKGTIWQNANAQRVRHCSKSTHHVFCSAPMLYFEQCMTCHRQQARSKPAVISISRGEI
jgi:hypothetical protein